LRDVYEALSEEPNGVDECLRRLWKKGIILRTREPIFKFEINSKGRAGVVGYTQAINYYAIDNGDELPAAFVKYDERKKDGRSRDVESKAYGILNYLNNNKEKAFYSNDIVKALGVKSCDKISEVASSSFRSVLLCSVLSFHDSSFKTALFARNSTKLSRSDRLIKLVGICTCLT